MLQLNECEGFDWDQGNINKNKEKHQVEYWECEQVFFNQPLLLMKDTDHSHHESRFYVLGKSDNERRLFIAFTVRKKLIRIISARDMSRKEREVYEKSI
ncbi:MAG: BrnT family toxin [Gammaproteobacteria bacterium]